MLKRLPNSMYMSVTRRMSPVSSLMQTISGVLTKSFRMAGVQSTPYAIGLL
ncbi:hypothetical protein D3C75_1341180 [compost metagenome]